LDSEVTVTVLLVAEAERAGDEDMAHCAISGRAERVKIPARHIAADARVPALELPGRQFSARLRSAPGGEMQLADFRLLNDPRE